MVSELLVAVPRYKYWELLSCGHVITPRQPMRIWGLLRICSRCGLAHHVLTRRTA